jgi:hypothetical protein
MANRKVSKVVPALGVAALGMLAVMGSASAAPATGKVAKVSLSDNVQNVAYNLHPRGQTTGFWGKGAVPGHRAYGHRHHR